MHRPIFGHSFAVLVAPILLSVLAFNFFNKKKASARRNAEDGDSSPSGSLSAPMETTSGGSSSSTPETNSCGSSSSSAPTGNHYEVFLSFRGPDTREGFTDHLYNGLVDAGIHAFRDDEELRQGEEIGPDLLAAIKNSKILIPILSVNYGSSKWCLDELVQIMECKNDNTGTIVLPIFYKVEPADVRYQKGSFGDAFRTREKYSDPMTLKKWKDALTKVCSLKGREAKGYEGELVKSVVQQVLLELKKKFELVLPENLVGIDSHVKKVMEFVDSDSCATLFVGIHGMGGIGKTTLAKMIYNKLSNQFEHRSFIADIRESCKGKGLDYLQNQLIYDILKQKDQVSNKDEGIKFISSKFEGKKVLILLDDVDHDDQLEALAGNHNWFSLGSMIIITTRNKSILDKARVDNQYEHEEMDGGNSLILFSRHAFRRDSPPSEFKDLTHDVVSTTGGLPLSLEVIGSFLCGRDTKVWEDTIEKLRKVPHEEVQKKLRISYEALTHEQKQIFVDIACFFIGTDWRITYYMWKACNFFPGVGIEVLGFLSLIKVGDDHKLIMHDQLRDLGREIVREENRMEPRNRSRLWDSKEALEVLKGNEGTKKIEAIYLGERNFEGFGKTTTLTGNKFKKLRNLRFLDVSWAKLHGDFENSMEKLKWLRWKYCPSTFEAKNFRVEELRVLNLEDSSVSDEWQGWSWIKMAKELKYLNLSYCQSLKKASFLSAFENLEVLILRGGLGIKQIDSWIGSMKSLVRLDLMGCDKLERLPAEVGKLEALEQLLLEGCGCISSLPDTIGDLRNLEILNIRHTGIKELPDGIGRLRKLQDLDASNCKQLSGNLPESIGNLSSLQRLQFYGCRVIQSLLVLPSSLIYLSVSHQSRRLPSLSNLTHLKELHLYACESLECIPSEKSLNTPFKLEILVISCSTSMKTLDISQFNHMRTLSVKYCKNLLEIRGLDKLIYLESLDTSHSVSTSLESIHISNCSSIETLFDLSSCTNLRSLAVLDCGKLTELRGLEKLKRLQKLNVSRCFSMETLPDLSLCTNLSRLDVRNCKKLIELRGLEKLERLQALNVSGCSSIKTLLDLSSCTNLRKLAVRNCEKLTELRGLEKLEQLRELRVSRCSSIETLPDFSSCTKLRHLAVRNCEKLTELQGPEKLENLMVLDIFGCKSLKTIPELPRRTWVHGRPF